jgi:hypothetical protein
MAPDPYDAEARLEGDLGSLSDEDWRTAHEGLRGVLPDAEHAYEWRQP